MCEIGEVFSGFCEGYFGRDAYGDKRVEAFGVDWIVTRVTNGTLYFATFADRNEKDEAIIRWRKEK